MADKKLPFSSNSYSAWSRITDRYNDEVWPVITNSFLIEKNAEIFTIGSCFAVNIAKYLHCLGYRVPTHQPGFYMNRYNPHHIRQEIEFAEANYVRGGFDEKTAEKFCINLENGRCCELDTPGFSIVAKNEFIERRRQLYEIFSGCFRAKYIVITLGMIEAWHYEDNDVYLLSMPMKPARESGWEKFRPVCLSFSEAYAQIKKTIGIIRKHNPLCHFLITTSPIPMARTFTGKDVIVANNHSKSLLRAVCAEIESDVSGTDYFPSYEIVTLSKRKDIWEEDLLHLKPFYVGKIVTHVLRNYCPDIDEDRLRLGLAKIACDEGRYGDCLDALKEIKDENSEYSRIRLWAMFKLKKYEEVIAEPCTNRDDMFYKALACMATDNKEDGAAFLLYAFTGQNILPHSLSLSGGLFFMDVCRDALVKLINGKNDAESSFRKVCLCYEQILSGYAENKELAADILFSVMKKLKDVDSLRLLRMNMETGLCIMKDAERLLFGSSALYADEGIYNFSGEMMLEKRAELSRVCDEQADIFVMQNASGATEFYLRSFLSRKELERLFFLCLLKGVVYADYEGSVKAVRLKDGASEEIKHHAVFGTAAAGRIANDILTEHGLSPVCFIDDFRTEKVFLGVRVLSRAEFAELYPDKNSTAVIKGPAQAGDMAPILDSYRIITPTETFNNILSEIKAVSFPADV